MSNNISETLKNAFANKTLIPLVGAGVSMSLKNKSGEKLFPSWPGLLERAACKLETENKSDFATAIRSMVQLKKYQEAANLAREGLVGGLWNQLFSEAFDINSADIDEDSLVLPKAIWNLSERVVTLNYDKILRITCPRPHDVRQLDSTTKGTLADFNRNSLGKPAIWHLHGSLDKLEKIIFTSDRYDRLYAESDPEYKAALTTFQSLCSTTTLLFIGCSLDDAELLQQLGSQHGIFAGNVGPHYALVREADKALIQTKLTDLPIELISFTDFGQPLLDTIAAISRPTHDATAMTTPVPKPVAPTSTPVNPTKRIAILTANPIGENYDYGALLVEFAKLNCETSYYPLTLKALNSLDGFDYIFIFSKLIKNNIVIEDDALQRARSNFKNIEDNIGNNGTNGVFIFLDHATKTVLESPDISTDISNLQLPTVIFPNLEKSQLSSFSFQYFKKDNFDYIPEAIIANKDSFLLSELKGTRQKNKTTSRLSESIDKKNTEQYLGRKTDLQNLCREVVALQGVDEILTIKGPGGTGKTATVKKIAVALSERLLFSEGIDFVDCEFIGDYSSFEKKLAACFNLENALDIPQEIKSKISKQDKLIILDNVETLLHLPDTQQIKDFIYVVCDYASLVITTREILDLSCEKVIELSRFSSDDAYALFVKYLRRDPKDATEQRLIRQDIVEELLDNNPLAIKLVASNLPSSKKMYELKQELEEDFFRKASADELSDLDSPSDINIERKKSLYASINFSYKHLDEAEKKAFEILSLFPDGIHMNALKIIAGERKTTQRKPSTKTLISYVQAPVITDAIIRNLENKSVIQVENQIIKLQSIMGKFAERQLLKRKETELTNYYQRASAYHIKFARYLTDLGFSGDWTRAAIQFNQQQVNFFKSIDYLHATDTPAETLLDYLEDLSRLTVLSTSSAIFAACLTKAESLRARLQADVNTHAQRCFEVIVLYVEYYAGNFAQAFTALQQQVPLNTLQKFAAKSLIERIIDHIAIKIYTMEGEALLALKYHIDLKSNFPSQYPISLLRLGEINSTLLLKYKNDQPTLEAKYILGILSSDEIDNFISYVYEKNHLELMEAHYLKAKLNLSNKKIIDKQQIQSLVITNSYTRGLQQLMLAFASHMPVEAIALYEHALKNLNHINYYYVEALLHYARFLQQQNLQAQFAETYQQGYKLACQHHYRWLRYQFEDLIEKKPTAYNSADYPLPEALDIEGHIQWLIKQR